MHVDFKQIPKTNATQIGKNKTKQNMKLKLMKAKEQNPETGNS